MVSRRGVSLRWRIALFSSLAIAFLSILASLAAYAVVSSSLVGNLRQALEADVARVANEYNISQTPIDAEADTTRTQEDDTGGTLGRSDLQSVATGGIIQLYDSLGGRFAASNDADTTDADANTTNELTLPTEVVLSSLTEPRSWRGEVNGQAVQAALSPVDLGAGEGVVAVVSFADYIGAALGRLARFLALVAGVFTLFSIVLGYLVAAAAARPVTQLATAAAQLGPNQLTPIAYSGPNDEVGQLSTVLNDLVTRLKVSADAQRTFLAETSHELRTPLTSLQGFLDRAVRRAPDELRGELGDAQRIAHSMTRLVADLLQLSRGQLVREYTPHLLDPMTDILKPVAEEFPGVRLEAQPGSLLLGDPDRLRQLVRNLVANAVRATDNPRKVTLGLFRTDGLVVLMVRDRGPGISEELLPHIFEKFHKGVGGGAGLGLAIAKQIADAHDGTLEVESFGGRGTTFRLTLAAVEEENEPSQTLQLS